MVIESFDAVASAAYKALSEGFIRFLVFNAATR